jgi:putative membrane protein
VVNHQDPAIARFNLANLRKPPLAVRLGIAWLTNAILLWFVVALLPDASTRSVGSLLEAAAVYGVLNTFLKPLLRFITLPLAILSFGLVWYLVSLFMLELTKSLVGGFHIHGFLTYVLAGLIIWAVNMALDLTPGPWQLTGKRRKRREMETQRERLRSFLRQRPPGR